MVLCLSKVYDTQLPCHLFTFSIFLWSQRLLKEETKVLSQEYDDLRDQQVAEDLEHKMKIKHLDRKINDKKSQHQVSAQVLHF